MGIDTAVLGHPDRPPELSSGQGRGGGVSHPSLFVERRRTPFQAFVIDYVRFFRLQNTPMFYATFRVCIDLKIGY
jgi:hypothetical protein